ncbi:MAG TPA: carboxypeptidase-like regulatory domain-containing protein, partial [Thermoanaerobaculia bacterium]|nr:carboxypeptidase-like regulatory domain-containing protein [Thermoanaerobaculia bacterium]
MRRPLVPLSLVLLLLGGALGAFAQGVTNATLRGRVTNEGQGLPGVVVSIKSAALQGTRAAPTSANGDYVFPGLPPGEYTATFTLPGFKTETRTVAVTVGQEVRLDAVLSLAGVEAAATVVAKSETVSTSTPQAAQTFTKELTDALPVARTLLSSVALSAGVNTNGPGSSDRLGNGVAP